MEENVDLDLTVKALNLEKEKLRNEVDRVSIIEPIQN